MGRRTSYSQIDIDFYQEHKVLYNRLKTVLWKLRIWTRNTPRHQQLFQRGLDSLKPMPFEDRAILISGNTGVRAKQIPPLYSKIFCLLVTVCYIITEWHGYCKKEISPIRINHYINYLENIAVKGVDSFKIIGDIKTGYRLKEE